MRSTRGSEDLGADARQAAIETEVLAKQLEELLKLPGFPQGVRDTLFDYVEERDLSAHLKGLAMLSVERQGKAAPNSSSLD